MRTSRALWTAGAACAVVVSAASLGLAAAGGKPATPSAATPKAKALTLTGGDVSQLAPGSPPQDLGVRVSNPRTTTGAVRVQTVTATVDAARSRIASGCVVVIDPATTAAREAADIVIVSYDADRPGTEPVALARDSAPQPVPLSIEMRNRGERQDPCKGAVLRLDYLATAAGR